MWFRKQNMREFLTRVNRGSMLQNKATFLKVVLLLLNVYIWILKILSKCSISVGTSVRAFSSGIHVFPQVTDHDVKRALKDVLASDWGELEGSLKSIVMDALSKETDDKSGKEALANACHSAEAVEHFSGVLESLRIEIDDISGSTGERENCAECETLPDELQVALQAASKQYSNYLDAFGLEETYLRKKVENEPGTRMIHIKMILPIAYFEEDSGIFLQVTLLGTSGISGSYIEQHSKPKQILKDWRSQFSLNNVVSLKVFLKEWRIHFSLKGFQDVFERK